MSTFSNYNISFSFDRTTFQSLYYKYKEFLMPVGIIVVCILLFVLVVMNQFQDLLSSQAQTQEVNNRIAVLKNNLSILSTFTKDKQNLDLKIVGSALPSEKDFAGVLNAMTTAAAKSHVGLADFTLQIGDLSSLQVGSSGFSSLLVTFTVRGTIAQTQQFLAQLKQSVPLSSVISVQAGTSSSTVAVEFYFKPVGALKTNYTSPLRTLTKEELQLLDQLNQWISGGTSPGQ